MVAGPHAPSSGALHVTLALPKHASRAPSTKDHRDFDEATVAKRTCIYSIATNTHRQYKMSNLKDSRRADLSKPTGPQSVFVHDQCAPRWTGQIANCLATVVPYQPPATGEESADFSSSISSTLPMAAMLTRNKFVGWASFVFSLQSWLGESAEAKSNTSTPGYFSVGMACKFLRLTLCIPEGALRFGQTLIMGVFQSWLSPLPIYRSLCLPKARPPLPPPRDLRIRPEFRGGKKRAAHEFGRLGCQLMMIHVAARRHIRLPDTIAVFFDRPTMRVYRGDIYNT